MEVKIKEKFRHEGNEFKEGEIVSLPPDPAERAIERGFAEKVGEEKEKVKEKEKRKERKELPTLVKRALKGLSRSQSSRLER